ncbi:hypothetical protein Ocin01_09558 [Orchesella cincta]|uniref:Uncharacterized protein n=1 Tax=Orchesella cincta TaxID=48709 RepID=A0A1D2MVK6_ORCCI|nr:hypothetical protein Ocin01_09558 [Orchesella cincta]
MVIGAQNTNGNVQSRRDNNGFPNGSAGNGNNGNGGGNASSPESGPNLYGAHSFQNGAAAHAFINAALGAGNHVGTVAAATSITNQQLFQQQGPRGAYGTSLSGSYPFNATGITRGRQNSSFGNVMGLHQMPTAPGMRFPRQTPCPASAMILVAEVQDPPRSPGPAYLMNGHHGSPGFPLLADATSVVIVFAICTAMNTLNKTAPFMDVELLVAPFVVQVAAMESVDFKP